MEMFKNLFIYKAIILNNKVIRLKLIEKLESYFYLKYFEKLPKDLPAVKISKIATKDEIFDGIIFYSNYCFKECKDIRKDLKYKLDYLKNIKNEFSESKLKIILDDLLNYSNVDEKLIINKLVSYFDKFLKEEDIPKRRIYWVR